MKPLLVLIISFLIAVGIFKLTTKQFRFALSGRLSLAIMLVFTALGHFMFTEGMAIMLPHFIPYKKELVHITGLIEILAAFGLMVPKVQKTTGKLLILFFILILPVNIYAAFNHIDYQTGSFNGPGLSYLWFRVPFQILLIIWTYKSAVR